MWEGENLGWQEGGFQQSWMARRGDLLGFVGRECGLSSRSAALRTYPGARVWLAPSTPDMV